MMNEGFEGLMWAYRATFKQENVAGGSIVVRITPRERMMLLYGRIGANDYAAGRTVNVWLRDSADNYLAQIMDSTSVDNISIPFPVDTVTVVDGQAGQFYNRMIMVPSDYIYITATSLVQNEELTLAIRAIVEATKPFVETTGSGGTVTVTTTYDKVM